MNTKGLPTDELKKYGIIEKDNSFSKKLNSEDIQKFLQGYTIVADNDKSRATFQLTDNNTQLKVIFLERDKSISELLKNSKSKIEFANIHEIKDNNEAKFSFEKKAFIFDQETNNVVEFDFIKNARELTAIVADTKNTEELDRYIKELLKLKSLLQDKMVQFPEMAKEISNDLNIVSKEFNTVAGISEKQNHSQKQEKSDIQLNVNDPDIYQDANLIREENEEQDEEIQKSRGFRR